jgi:prepilin-type N-terminal cleavage/methylation domain-containing protein
LHHILPFTHQVWQGGYSMTRGDGFSLFELIVTVALMSILGAIGALGHRAMRPGLDLSSAARQVVMDLKVTRMRAVARNVNHRIVFAEGGGSYQPQRKVGSQYSDEGPPVSLPSGIAILNCSALNAAIGFRPRGNATTFGTVTLRNAVGATRQVVVDIAGGVRMD